MAEAAGSAKKRAQKKDALSDILTDSVRARQKAETSQKAVVEGDPRFAGIATNPYFSVMFAESSTPEAKRAAITKLLTFEGTKEDNREKLKAFELFKEYLQSQREEMAQEIIRLTNTETFAELKSVYDELNGSLIDFDNRMKPLTDIIDAVYTLRTNGMTVEAFQEIIRDRARERELLAKKRALNSLMGWSAIPAISIPTLPRLARTAACSAWGPSGRRLGKPSPASASNCPTS